MNTLLTVAFLLLTADHARLVQSADGQISGVVLDAVGQPLANQRLELPMPSTGLYIVVVSDANGLFAFKRLAPGRYQVRLSVDDRVVARSEPVVLVEGAMQAQDVTVRQPAPPREEDEPAIQLSDPTPTRLFFAPTARALRRGEGYFGLYDSLLPFVQVGLTDRVSMGAGVLVSFERPRTSPFWVTPKVQIYEHGRASVALGVLHFMNVGDGHFGIVYAVTTYGERDNAVTANIGYVYSRYSHETHGAVIGMIGGQHRVSRRVTLMTENHVFPGAGVMSLNGVKWRRARMSWDFGLWTMFGSTGGPYSAPIGSPVWNW